MRHATAIFFVILLSLPLWVKGFVLLHFMANRAYIVEHYCENRDKPQMHCEGKCYLNKQLKKAEPVKQDTIPEPATDWILHWELTDFDYLNMFFEGSVCFYFVQNSFLPDEALALSGFPVIIDSPPDFSEQLSTRG
ncbi:MAG: hypothetical protein NW218_18460 [Saprospiraceae bacterium]|nr:hypothetical protein [Saprospiraceae bacterium]